jgi:hypothetical protein
VSDTTPEGGERRQRAERPPPVRGPREALAWGVVGSLVFLVLHQAYLLLDGTFLGFVPVTLVALAVGAVVAGTAHLLGRRLSENGQR